MNQIFLQSECNNIMPNILKLLDFIEVDEKNKCNICVDGQEDNKVQKRFLEPRFPNQRQIETFGTAHNPTRLYARHRWLSWSCVPSLCPAAVVLPAARLQDFQDPSCLDGSCNPPLGDLMVGRGSQLSASSTCGQRGPQNYCILGYLEVSGEDITLAHDLVT